MKILMVDDNRGFLNVMGDLLTDYGYEVLLAEDGKQARELLEDHRVDLIISDVFMPTLDGTRFHSYVREFTESSSVPFIFISGFDDEYTRKVVVDSSIDFFVSKTAPFDTIVKLIESIKAKRGYQKVKTDG
jgi:DNA-binding response OmpR family regulator